MATIKIKFRPSSVRGQEGVIFYRITHNRTPRQISTSYHIFPDEWNDKRATITLDKRNERAAYLISVKEMMRRDVDRLNRIVQRFENSCLTYTTDDVVNEFRRYNQEYSLHNYIESRIELLRQNGRVRTAETYRAALNNFRKFHGDDIMLDCITPSLIEAYEAWLKQQVVTKNTISFYMRILRANYRRAVDEGIIDDLKPFRRVYTGVDKTVKRALPLKLIRSIKRLNLSSEPRMDYARDIFMLSFMLRGMSFIDMAFLKKSDCVNGTVVYCRRKTGQQLTIEWTPEMQEIVNKYPENKTEYLLPIITSTGINERCAYRNALCKINKRLKGVAEKIKLNDPLTLYVARHSWASAAKAKGIPIGVISEGLGHDSEATTRIYLASLETSAVDKANSIILKSIS